MNAREKILDAASTVMRERGIAAATTKEIARAAGYSEATLYKHFDDKQHIFISVLKERLPSFGSPLERVGAGTVRANLESIVEQLMRFYVGSFPMAASVLGSPELLAVQRQGVRAKGAGPEGPENAVRLYLEGEVAGGRLPDDFDAPSSATLLTGSAMYSAFIAIFNAKKVVADARGTARRLVAAVLPADVA